jgi:arginine-tRNA-protein transferase
MKGGRRYSMPQNQEIVQHFQTRGNCLYFADHRESRTEYLIFGQEVDPLIYGTLIRDGWRRYGKAIYRMRCPGCSLCIPLRIHAVSVRVGGSLRRILLRNRDLLIIPRPPVFTEEHYLLWRNYSLWKHSSAPDELDEASYCQLFEPWSLIFEYRENSENRRLLALSHVDPLAEGLSSVYFSFASEAKGRSLGFFSMLAEACIAASMESGKLPLDTPILASSIVSFYTGAKRFTSTGPGTEGRSGVPSGSRRYYYLGFWIPGAPKMDYKARIGPFELATDEGDSDMGSRWRHYGSQEKALAYLRGKRWPGLPP